MLSLEGVKGSTTTVVAAQTERNNQPTLHRAAACSSSRLCHNAAALGHNMHLHMEPPRQQLKSPSAEHVNSAFFTIIGTASPLTWSVVSQ
jgi:hypothetical protein